MSKFVLPCNHCGSSVIIARSQAGMTIPCDGCGQVLQAPTIRNFGTLQQVEAETPVAATPKGSLWLSLLAAIAFIVGAGSLAYTGVIGWEHYTLLNQAAVSKMDLTKNEADYIRDVRSASMQATPADTWDYWNEMTQFGLSQASTPDFFRFKRYLEAQRPVLFQWGTISAVSFSIFAAIALMLRRPKKSAGPVA
jgi:hypothetical protein